MKEGQCPGLKDLILGNVVIDNIELNVDRNKSKSLVKYLANDGGSEVRV